MSPTWIPPAVNSDFENQTWHRAWGDEKTAWSSQFPPCTTWVLGNPTQVIGFGSKCEPSCWTVKHISKHILKTATRWSLFFMWTVTTTDLQLSQRSNQSWMESIREHLETWIFVHHYSPPKCLTVFKAGDWEARQPVNQSRTKSQAL